jgi:hypothetical protein
MGIQLDRFVDKMEKLGSDVAFVPGVGLLKTAGGLIQTTTAIACAILLFLPAVVMGKEGSLMKNSWTHIKHGMGNVLAGTLEAIPVVGAAICIWRDTLFTSATNVAYSQLGKFMPYESLIEDDVKNNRLIVL